MFNNSLRKPVSPQMLLVLPMHSPLLLVECNKPVSSDLQNRDPRELTLLLLPRGRASSLGLRLSKPWVPLVSATSPQGAAVWFTQKSQSSVPAADRKTVVKAHFSPTLPPPH